jgi:hypothetical protein
VATTALAAAGRDIYQLYANGEVWRSLGEPLRRRQLFKLAAARQERGSDRYRGVRTRAVPASR